MADNELNIVITATDKASAALKGVRGSIITLNQGLQLAEQAFGMVKKVVEESVGAYVKYADQVRRLSQLNGTSAQETSRLIQVTDDHKVSVEALTMATRKLSQQGLSLTIESLGKMSDEYIALGTSSEKTRFLLEKFGRSGLQFAETMNLGSAAINAESAAISQNLILNQKALRAAREYEMQIDELEDTVQGLKVALGTALMPTMLDATSRVKEGIGAWSALGGQWEKINYLLAQKFNPGMYAMETALRAANAGLTEADIIAQKLAVGLTDLSESGNDAAEAVDLLGIAMSGIRDSGAEMAAGLYQAKLAADGVLDEADVQNILNFRESIGLLTAEERSAADTAIALAAAINGLPADRVLTVTTWYLSGYGKAEGSYGGAVKTPGGSTRRASGGSIPAGGMAWVGDSPSGLTPHSELVYAPHGAQVFNANQSRSMGSSGSPRAFTGGMIPGASSEMSLSNDTIRRLASEIAGAVARVNG